MKYTKFLRTPLGKMLVASDGDSITGVYFQTQLEPRHRFQAGPQMALPSKVNAVMQKAEAQINEYFEGKRTSFDLPLSFEGTDFQKKVWGELLKIPFGTTISYKELAIRVGNEKGSRAVGTANSKNPISILVPCHRVIGENGSLTGYAGGLENKKYLLSLESSNN